MATWATQRKITFASLFVTAALIFIVIPLFVIFHKTPTCYDNMMNADETGVDCGGNCSKMCSSDFLSPNVLWSRSEKVANGVYNLGAYIENPNLDGVATNVSYLFKVYDKDGVPIVERSGTGYFPAHQNVLFFEPSVLTGERIPARVTFEFTAPINWYSENHQSDTLVVSNKQISGVTATPRLEATIENTGIKTLENIDVVGIAYDINDNTIGFSRTKVDTLNGGQSTEVVFTWQLPFDREVTRTEIIPTIKP